MKLLSFDIDGTCIFGDPPGPVTVDMLKAEIANGNIIIGGSDWRVVAQKEIFQRNGINIENAYLKKDLIETKQSWLDAERRIHIGDTSWDKEAAETAGFEYMTPEEYVESLNKERE